MDKKELLKYVVAFCYGDGGVYGDNIHGWGNCRFDASSSDKHMDYIEWRASILSEISKVRISPSITKINGREYKGFRTRCGAHPFYTKIRQRMYKHGRKVLDPHYLKLFDWETLAILFMDDGTADLHGRAATPQVRIATMSFSYADNYLLKEIIKNNLGIVFNIRKFGTSKKTGEIQWMLTLPESNYNKFKEGVEKYILPSFNYKINPVRLAPRNLGEGTVQSSLKDEEVSRNDLLAEEA